MTDHWPEIDRHLTDVAAEVRNMVRWSTELHDLIEQRFRAGEREYQGDWLTRPLRWFDTMAAEEVADLFAYLAMRRVRAEHAQGTPPPSV